MKLRYAVLAGYSASEGGGKETIVGIRGVIFPWITQSPYLHRDARRRKATRQGCLRGKQLPQTASASRPARGRRKSAM